MCFCTGKYCKYFFMNTSLSKVSDLPSALEKTVTAAVSCFDSNPEFLSPFSVKSVIAIGICYCF